MVFNNNLLLGAAGQSGAFDTTLIERSAWFDGAADNLTKSFGSGADQQEFVLAAWVQRNSFGSDQFFFGSGDLAKIFSFGFNANDQLELRDYDAPINARYITNARFRDTGWYHVLTSIKTSEIVASNRVKIFVNGSEITSFSTETDPSLNFDMNWGISGDTHAIGSYFVTYGLYFFKGYITQALYISGKSIQGGDFTISDFLDTYTFGANGSQYVPRADADIAALATAAGGNSFCLTTAIGDGTDASGNGNNFTPTSMSDAANGTADTPSDTYALLNPLDTRATTYTTIGLANGNLELTYKVGNAARSAFGDTLGGGKWVFEVTMLTAVGSSAFVGWSALNVDLNNSGTQGPLVLYASNGNKYVSSTSGTGAPTISAYGATYNTIGDVIRVEADFTASTIEFFKNGTSQGSISISGMNDGTVAYFPSVYGSNASLRVNFGQQPFIGTPTAGFKALSTANLPTPAYQGIDYFNPILYTGNGSTNAITGVGFQPDLVWIKNRTGSTSHSLYDAVRGVQKQLESDNNSAETTEATGLTAFGSDGFTVESLAQVNTNTNNFVGWNWLAGGAGASNTDGSITSTVSKAAAGHFSIVTYTGTGAAATVGHGLGGVPNLIIVKNRGTTGNWAVQSSETSYATNVLYLDLTNASAAAGVNVWNNTDPTSSVFSVGLAADTNASTNTYVAYCFKNVPGVCKIGSYKGNGSADGPFSYTGFRPSWVMVKRTDSTTDWHIIDVKRDPYNVMDSFLFANLSLYESSDAAYNRDLLSDGFKIRASLPYVNASGGSFLFIAMADIAGGGDLPPIYGR
jgi:hypothetical protein